MAFEVACSQCEGRLMVEEAGVIVACPHCGAHLNIEAPAEPAPAQPDASEPDPSAQNSETETPVEQSSVEEPAQPIVETPEAANSENVSSTEPETTDQPAAPSFESAPETQIETALPETPAPAAELPGEPMPYLGETPVGTEPEVAAVVSGPAVGKEQDEADEEVSGLATSENGTTQGSTTNVTITNTVGASAPIVATGRGVSRHTFTLVRNYAIAMTIAVIFLVYKLLNPNMSALESLPDVKPPKKDDKIVYKLVPEATEMPPGHLLSLGQSQRFGNLKVTPVRVTKEPVEFVHHQGNEAITRDATSDVVKLWFEFENLSADQSIAPLDGLVFKRDDNDWENVRSNNFVCRRSEKKKGGKLVFVYDHLITGQWNLRDHNIEQEIAPGEKIQTYIPTTEEGIAQLLNSNEPLVWRVQFRKGYSPKNYGVTTVIEVAFESSDIGAASPTAPKTAEPTEESA